MKPNDANERGVFLTGTSVTDSGSWYSSLIRQLRDLREERKNPPAPLEITAASDPSALQRLVETPSPIVSMMSSVKAVIHETLHPRTIETTAAPVEVPDIWSRHNMSIPGVLSLVGHVAVLILLLIPWVSSSAPPEPTETAVMLYTPPPPMFLELPAEDTSSGGGGGGGMQAPTPPSIGEIPRAAEIQLAPPMPEVRALDPDLLVEPTIIAPQLAHLPRPLLMQQLGDPTGIPGPPSFGPGTGGGIGTGDGHGIGEGTGPGLGPGEGGGVGGGLFRIGGGVTAPVVTYQQEPEYSEEARRARYQGTVVLETIFRANGTIDVVSVKRALGMGLDQNAIDVLKK